MVDAVLISVALALLLNLVVALLVIMRRREGDDWLLAVLLVTTSGAGVAVLLSRLTHTERTIDIALVLTATAVVTAAVRAAARIHTPPAAAAGQGEST